tara:strand:- start:4843 stop:6192 length:1350 start_codon:yes stop_codon:yes gene_type:complete
MITFRPHFDHFLGLLIACLFVCQATAETWPQFRGPTGDGISTARDIPSKFSEDKSLNWKTQIPGKGWSSPVYDGKYLWLTTALETFPDEEERIRLLTEAGEEEKKFKQKQIARSVELVLIKVDYETGDIVKQIRLTAIDKPNPIHKFNSYASPTPFLSGDRLIAHFGTYGTFSLSTSTGEVEWSRKIELVHSVGPGSSPFVHNGLLILICDGVDRQFVTALDVTNGDTIWTTERPEMRAESGDQKKSYNTPVVITGPKGREQLICMGSQWLISYEVETGEVIWQLDHGKGFSVVPRPVYSEKHGLLYIVTGFGKPELLAIRPDGKGDVTEEGKIVWREPKRIPTKPSPLLVGEEIYVISDGGITSCFDAPTGELLWNVRIEGNYSSSPHFVDGKIMVASEEGRITFFEPGRDYKELSVNHLDGSVMASPITLDSNLVIRSDTALYRFTK